MESRQINSSQDFLLLTSILKVESLGGKDTYIWQTCNSFSVRLLRSIITVVS
jgi:hypothetical protein